MASVHTRHGQGPDITATVTATAKANVTDVEVASVRFFHGNVMPKRSCEIVLLIDGEYFIVDIDINDETLEERDLLGHPKKRRSATQGVHSEGDE